MNALPRQVDINLPLLAFPVLTEPVTSAFADTSPNGPGQPGSTGGTTCQVFTVTPGNSANGQSPFNPTGQAGNVYAGNPDTPSLLNGSSNAVSQYDIACFQQTSH
jgi:hypothetical protein